MSEVRGRRSKPERRAEELSPTNIFLPAPELNKIKKDKYWIVEDRIRFFRFATLDREMKMRFFRLGVANKFDKCAGCCSWLEVLCQSIADTINVIKYLHCPLLVPPP